MGAQRPCGGAGFWRRGLFLAGLGAGGLALTVTTTTVAAVTAWGRPAVPGRSAVQSQSLTVMTDDGAVYGRTTGAVDQWLGIPYAAPPAGALRWEPPKPVKPWHGVLSALSYGDRCPQVASTNGPQVSTENCLNINVYAPAVIPPGTRMPVLFMIFSGRLVNGAGDQYDGSLIAQDEHVIVVSFNYRVGPFGFMALPGLTSSKNGADGNFGLLDQEAALRWVHRNIAAFGGDPSQVTIAGESSGGWSVCALLTSPPADGLFNRAIMQSGSCASQPQATTKANSLALAAAAGCPVAATAASCMRAKSAAAVLDASATTGYQPEFTAGGPELPVAPAQAVAAGSYDKVPILMGTNRDEARIFTTSTASYTRQQYAQLIKSLYGSRARTILRLYPFPAFPPPYQAAYALAAVLTDSGFITGIGGCPEQNLAQQFTDGGSPVYFYEFDDRHAPALSSTGPPGYQYGAGHAMELAYLWPGFTNGFSLYAELTKGQLQLSDQMISYWGAFVRRGAPQAFGQPAWPQYRDERFMSLRPGGGSLILPGAAFAAEHHCGFWNNEGKLAAAAGQPGTAASSYAWSPSSSSWLTFTKGR